MLLHWNTLIQRCATRWKDVAIREYLCICLRLVLIKGELVLIFRTNGRFSTKQIVFKVKVKNFTVNFGLFLFKLNQFSREARLTCRLLDQNKTFESDASLPYHNKRYFFLFSFELGYLELMKWTLSCACKMDVVTFFLCINNVNKIDRVMLLWKRCSARLSSQNELLLFSVEFAKWV